jgi:hypothetical protein|nr:MAG TPA: hypothetical protein [Caudoviricetes sp.]
MESTSPSGSPASELATLRIISHIHTAAWGVVDLRRSIERALPGDEGLAESCEALLDVLDQADAEAVHAYNHAVLGQCPQGFQATPMRNDNPHGRAFRMDGLEDPRPEQPETPDETRDDADTLF